MLAFFILAPGNPAQAQDATPLLLLPLLEPSICPVRPAYPLPVGALALQSLLIEIDANALPCLRSPTFHAWRGAVLWALQQPASAAEALERALLLNPDQPGAQLDYVQVLMALGDVASARGLLAQIASRDDVPVALKPLLERELAAFNAGQAWRSRWILTTAGGQDSNLNNAPTAAELTLTFDQLDVTLPLAAESRPKSGTALLAVVQWQGIKPQGRQLWVLQAEVRARRTAQTLTSYQQADLSASWLQAPEAPAQWIAKGGLSRIDFGGQPLLYSARASLQRQWQWQWQHPGVAALFSTAGMACRPSLGVEYEARRFPLTSSQDAIYAGGIAAVNCHAAAPGFWPGQWGMQLRTGTDQAVHESRPGGNQRRMEWRVNWEGTLGATKASADYSYAQQSDSTGYSALLDNNAVRALRRHSLRLELSDSLRLPSLPGADWFVSLEFNQQRSNLQAFANRQKVIYAGLRWSVQ